MRKAQADFWQRDGGVEAELLSMLERNAHPDEFTQLLDSLREHVADADRQAHLAARVRAAALIRDSQIMQQRRERGLLAVLETAQDLTAILDLELVLQAIVRRARQIFGSDIGYLTNYDRLCNDFYIRATDGAISERFKRVRVPLGHGICGYVQTHKTPYHAAHYFKDAGFVHDPGIDLAIQEEGVCSLLGAPLMAGNHVIGVLCICDREVRSYEPWEISTLSTLAAHASVAIENARLFQEAQGALQNASQANSQLHEQARQIASAAEAHEHMTRLVARGGSITELVGMVSKLLQAHVVMLDDGEQVRHEVWHPQQSVGPQDASAWIASPQGQEAIHKALEDSRRSGRSHLALAQDGMCIRVAAVNGADRLLGALILVSDQAMSENSLRSFERGALVAGVMLLSWERAEQASNSLAAATLRDLVDRHQDNPIALQARLDRYGILASTAHRMLVLHIEGRDMAYALRRLRPAAMPKGLLMEECDGLLVAVIAQERYADLARHVLAASEADARLRIIGVRSGSVEQAADFPERFQSLKRCLDVLRALERSGEIVDEASLTLYAMLFEQRRVGDIDRFITAVIGPLVRQDQRRKTELCHTLNQFLDHARRIGETAQALGIHVNTLRQRLESINQLLDGWQEDGRVLEIHVALRLQRLRQQMLPVQDEA